MTSDDAIIDRLARSAHEAIRADSGTPRLFPSWDALSDGRQEFWRIAIRAVLAALHKVGDVDGESA